MTVEGPVELVGNCSERKDSAVAGPRGRRKMIGPLGFEQDSEALAAAERMGQTGNSCSMVLPVESVVAGCTGWIDRPFGQPGFAETVAVVRMDWIDSSFVQAGLAESVAVGQMGWIGS